MRSRPTAESRPPGVVLRRFASVVVLVGEVFTRPASAQQVAPGLSEQWLAVCVERHKVNLGMIGLRDKSRHDTRPDDDLPANVLDILNQLDGKK